MKLLTNGKLTVTPLRVTADLSLAGADARLGDMTYPGHAVAQGWGIVPVAADEHADEVDLVRHRDQPGRPEVYEDPDGGEFILARFLYDRPRRGLERQFTDAELEDLNADRTHELNAIDCMFFEGDNSLTVLVNSRTEKDVWGVVVPGVRKLFADDLDGGGGAVEAHPDFVPSPDLFRWLFYRLDGRQRLARHLDLDSIRNMHSIDGLLRGTQFGDGVELDRLAVLSELMLRDERFGPAKFQLTHRGAGLSVDMELALDGSFAVQVGRSYLLDGDDEMGRPLFGIELVRRVAQRVIPDLYAAYRGDSSWNPESREAFRVKCREALAQAVSSN